jgi:hypothetical protein
MNNVVAIITGLHVLAHSLFGCCWHQREDAGRCSTPGAADLCCETSSEGCFISHNDDKHCDQHVAAEVHGSEEASTNAEHCSFETHSTSQQPHQCPHASCQWLTSDSSGGLTVVVLCLVPAFWEPVIAATTFASAADPFAQKQLLESLALPLRLHLAVGLLLI